MTKMKKRFKTKIPRKKPNDGSIKMFGVALVLSAMVYMVSITLATIFVDGMYHWLLIFVVPYIAVFCVPPLLMISVIAYLLKLQNGFLNRAIIGLTYAISVVGGVAFYFSRDYGAPTINKEDSITLGVIFVLCLMVGFVSARFLPNKCRED